MIKTCFIGHRDAGESIREKAEAAIFSLLRLDDEFEFFNGGMGGFDNICAGVVKEMKTVYKQKVILSYLVLPYLTKESSDNREYYKQTFDGIILPDGFETTHYKAAIQKRNRVMIDRSDYIIAYVTHDFGGAAQSLSYAEKQRKTIIRI